jgi:hypothetical protein
MHFTQGDTEAPYPFFVLDCDVPCLDSIAVFLRAVACDITVAPNVLVYVIQVTIVHEFIE